jgi:hypothetical protein
MLGCGRNSRSAPKVFYCPQKAKNALTEQDSVMGFPSLPEKRDPPMAHLPKGLSIGYSPYYY